MTAKPCKNGCGQTIEWDNDNRYFVETSTGQRHMCPNWKRKVSEFKQAANRVEQEISGQSNQSIFKPNNALGKVAELETQMAHELKEIKNRISRNEQAIQALVKELSFKKGSEVQEPDVEEVIEED